MLPEELYKSCLAVTLLQIPGKEIRMKAKIVSLLMAALLLGGIGFVSTGFAGSHHSDEARMSPEKMMEMCQKMMERHEAMREKMAERDERLQGLVDRMNAATGEAKIEAMSDVINELAAQRRQMHEMMMKMGPMMMRHMMEHMHPEMMQEMMRQCPMMKEMEKNDHAGHH
jgi:hypothetical protein